MTDASTKPDILKPRLAKRPSMTVNRESIYRVSKAQSLRMRAYDKKVEAAEAKAKLQSAQKAKTEENAKDALTES
jgi:hypothetical protein